MNIKKFAALASFAAVLATTVAPAYAANPTGTVTIKWNTQSIATMALTTNYSATGAQGLGAPAIFQNTNGGAASAGCTAAGAGSEVALTVNFGNVTPDSAKYVDCLYDNGINAAVATNDTLGYAVNVQETTAPTSPGSYMLCLLPNGTYSNTGAVAQSTRTSNASVTSIVTTTASGTSCGAGNTTIWGTTQALYSSAAATAGANFGADVELVIAPNAPTGANSGVVTYTMALN